MKMSPFMGTLSLVFSFLVSSLAPAMAATLGPGAGNAVLFDFDFTSGLAVGLAGPCGSTPCPAGSPPYALVTFEVLSGGQIITNQIGMLVFGDLGGSNYLGAFPSTASTLPSSIGADGVFSIAFYSAAAPLVYDTIIAVGFRGSVPSAFVTGVLAVPEPSTWLLSLGGLAGVGALVGRRKRLYDAIA